MPLINLLFWLTMVLAAYFIVLLSVSYHRAEQKAHRQLLQIQLRQQIARQKKMRSEEAVLVDRYKKHVNTTLNKTIVPQAKYKHIPSHSAIITGQSAHRSSSLRPVQATCRFQNIIMSEQQHEVAEISFSWMRSSESSDKVGQKREIIGRCQTNCKTDHKKDDRFHCA